MAHFKKDPKNIKAGIEGGFKFHDHTNLGYLYAKISGGFLYRKIVTLTGRVLRYKPTKATRKELKLYG